jgi:PAS domain S-box-containing protein
MNRTARVTTPGTDGLEAGGNELVEQFRTIAEVAGGVAFIIDGASGLPRYISATVENLLGYAPGMLFDQFASQAAHGPAAQLCKILAERLRAFSAGKDTALRSTHEIDLKHRNGQPVPLEIISTVMVGQDGKALALVGVIRDLSGRRAREAEQKRFASMLNHEFRTPLSTIDGAIQRLEATAAGVDEPTRQRYRKIAVAVDRLIDMLDDYLSPERMASLGRERQPTSVSPLQLLEEGAALARAAGRSATVEAGDMPPALRCEPEGLRLALKVLLDNAIAFSPTDTPIVLTGRRAGGGLELAVRDHGAGVAADEAPRIFDKFFRGRNAAGLPGSGLGLYMARSVVEVHGGTLNLLPPDGGGAEFRLWLPAQAQVRGGKHLASGTTNSDNRTATPGTGAGFSSKPRR